MKIERFFLIGLQEMRFRNLTVRGYHPRIQMKSIVQHKSELDSGSAHKSHYCYDSYAWEVTLQNLFVNIKNHLVFKWSMVIFTSSL